MRRPAAAWIASHDRTALRVAGLAQLLIGVVLLAVALAVMPAAAQSPTGTLGPAATAIPSPAIIGTGDPRSDGQGPGLVGDPLFIALGVVGLGLLAAGTTALYVRFTRDD